MQRITKASPNDLPSLGKCFRRVEGDLEINGFPSLSHSYPKEEDFPRLVEEEQIILLKEGARVMGAAFVSSILDEALFPKTHDQKATTELLDSIAFRGEGIKVLRLCFLDPMMIGKGVAKEFIRSILLRYPETSWFTMVPKGNARAFSFMKKMGFIPTLFPLKEFEEDLVLFVKPYRPSGLCSAAFW